MYLMFCTGNINLMIAAGPFFSESSPHGKSLKSLIQKTIDSKAKLLILLGPIFDTDFGIHLNKSSTDSLQKYYDDILEPILTPLFRFVATIHYSDIKNVINNQLFYIF